MIPREQLPQIPKDKFDEFGKFLEDNGVKYAYARVPVKNLKPIQAQVNREKVEAMKKEPETETIPIIISREGLILDGHHRFLAQKEKNPNAKAFCLVAACSIKDLVKLGHKFEHSFTKSVQEATTYSSYFEV
jgi:hypothetical protein